MAFCNPKIELASINMYAKFDQNIPYGSNGRTKFYTFDIGFASVGFGENLKLWVVGSRKNTCCGWP